MCAPRGEGQVSQIFNNNGSTIDVNFVLFSFIFHQDLSLLEDQELDKKRWSFLTITYNITFGLLKSHPSFGLLSRGTMTRTYCFGISRNNKIKAWLSFSPNLTRVRTRHYYTYGSKPGGINILFSSYSSIITWQDMTVHCTFFYVLIFSFTFCFSF